MKIVRNIPMPPPSLRAVLRKLAGGPVGSSVFIPKTDYATDSIRGAVQAIGARWATSRKVTESGVDGIRIWKIQDLKARARTK